MAFPSQHAVRPDDSPALQPAPASRRREHVALAAILLLSLLLRAWGLERSGWGAEYYTAAVRSMAANWHNFFFCAFDPAGFISVDKPPLALWLQVAGVKLLGFQPLAVLLPQVVEGVLAVWLLFHLVRRRFGAAEALLAALLFATTPVWVAVNRTNNTDSCLLLVLLLAGWALLRAAEAGSRRLLLLAMALLGLAFNVKMLAGLVVLPVFFGVYFAGAPAPWRRRLADLLLGCGVLVVCAAPWVLAYELTPAEQRPFVGSSRANSMLELVVGHNALGRWTQQRKAPAPEVLAPVPRADAAADGPEPAAASDAGGGSELRRLLARQFVRSATGPLRLADGQLAAQTAWLLPFALAALWVGARHGRWRRPLAAAQLTLLFWFCWLATYWLVYSYLGGMMHFYYLATLAPALAALAGIGVMGLWRDWRAGGRRALVLPLLLAATALWQLHVEASALGRPFRAYAELPADWLGWLHAALIGGAVLAGLGLLAVRGARPGAGSLALGMAALLLLPGTWALSGVLAPGNGMLPAADLYRLVALSGDDRRRLRASREQQQADLALLTAFLVGHRSGERYLVATTTIQLAAPLIIATGEAVMARGGFHGLDPALDAQALARKVAAGELRFAMLGDATPVSRRLGADRAGAPVAQWIRENGRPVDPSEWRGSGRMAAMTLYDLRPPD